MLQVPQKRGRLFLATSCGLVAADRGFAAACCDLCPSLRQQTGLALVAIGKDACMSSQLVQRRALFVQLDLCLADGLELLLVTTA